MGRPRRDFVGILRLVAEEKAKLIADPGAFGVWVAVVHEADYKTGVAQFSARELADWYGWSRKTVTKHLNHLNAIGVIVWDKGRGGGDIGSLTIPDYDCVIGVKGNWLRTGTLTGPEPRQLDEGQHGISGEGSPQDLKTLSVSRSVSHSLTAEPPVSAGDDKSEDWKERKRREVERLNAAYGLNPVTTGGDDE